MQANGRLQFLLPFVELSKCFRKWSRWSCNICSSKDIIQPLFHAESLNVNNCWRQQNKEKCPRRLYLYFWCTFRKCNYFCQIVFISYDKKYCQFKKNFFFQKRSCLHECDCEDIFHATKSIIQFHSWTWCLLGLWNRKLWNTS